MHQLSISMISDLKSKLSGQAADLWAFIVNNNAACVDGDPSDEKRRYALDLAERRLPILNNAVSMCDEAIAALKNGDAVRAALALSQAGVSL